MNSGKHRAAWLPIESSVLTRAFLLSTLRLMGRELWQTEWNIRGERQW